MFDLRRLAAALRYYLRQKRVSFTGLVRTALFLILAFFAGTFLAHLTHPASDVSSVEPLPVSADGSWGLSFQQEGGTPTGNATADDLARYHAYYVGNTDDKIIYLTFDAGYENGNTPAILDALKKHQVSATFFLVGNYLNTSPDLVKRMVAEGHTIGNHTFHHPDMSRISAKEDFTRELQSLEELYEQVTGQKMERFYRPPQGRYSEANLKMADELGYQTFFWSLAYVDWYEDKQPSHEEALQKLTSRIHPGAIVLLHSTSRTNAEILDELLTRWEEMGYYFGTLEELTDTALSSSESSVTVSMSPSTQKRILNPAKAIPYTRPGSF